MERNDFQQVVDEQGGVYHEERKALDHEESCTPRHVQPPMRRREQFWPRDQGGLGKSLLQYSEFMRKKIAMARLGSIISGALLNI